MTRCVVALLVAMGLVAGAFAQPVQRAFPANALRGEIMVAQPPEILLNGQPARLSPGARIRGQNNLLAMSGSLAGLRLIVHYVIDSDGQVRDVWILSEAERAKEPWPTTPLEAKTWVFDAAAQSWSRR
jgi:acyl-coenzyme A synthetase/AMP-(fatty) acid ligase